MADETTGDETTEAPPTVGRDASELLREIRGRLRKLNRAKKLLQAVDGSEPDPRAYEAWLELHQGLEDRPLDVADLDELRESLVERLGDQMQKLGVKARMRFLTKLDLLASQDDLEVERLSEAPLVVYIKPFTVEIDFDGGGARLLFGHEEIREISIDATEILEARRAALRKAKAEVLEPEAFFDVLHRAYRMTLARDGGEPGARVDLVDVLTPLALLRAETKDLRKKGPGALDEIPRWILAWQLAKQRREGLLEHRGLRLDLGAATGGSTRNKRDVLFIPIGATGGQYYGSLRFEHLHKGTP